MQVSMELSEETKAKEEGNIKMAKLMGRPPLVVAVDESDPGHVPASMNYDNMN